MPLSVTLPDSGVPGLVIVVVAGAVLSSRTAVTVAEVVVRATPSVAIAWRSYSPSASAAVFQEQENGLLALVQAVVQVPDGEVR